MARSKRVLFFALFLAFLGGAFVPLGGCGQAAGLSYSFSKGDTVSYDLTAIINGSLEAPGVSRQEGIIPKDAKLRSRFTAKVEEVHDGLATIKCTYDSFEMLAEGQSEIVPVQDLPALTIEVDKHGRILSLTGGEGGILSGLTGRESTLPLDLGEVSLLSFVSLPVDGRLTLGEEWNVEEQQSLPVLGQPVKATTKAKIVSIVKERRNQLVGVEYSLDMPVDVAIDLAKIMAVIEDGTQVAPPARMQLIMTVKGVQYYKGKATLNLTRGMPVSVSADGTLKLELEVQEAPEDVVPQNERGPFTIELMVQVSLEQVE